MAFLEKRENSIADSLKDAANKQKEAEHLLHDYRSKLAEAQANAEKMLKEVKNEGEKLKLEIINNAEKQAEVILKKAEQDLSREKEKIFTEAKNQIADLVVSATSKLLEKSFNKEANHKMIIESINEASKS